MKVIVLGLYAEGSTDYAFLPSIIKRTAEKIINKYEHYAELVVENVVLAKGQYKKRDECILYAARKSTSYDALIVHSDADHPTSTKAKSERFLPGYRLVQEGNENICKHLLPIIPIQAIEAWMLADYQHLLTQIDTKLSANDLNIPQKARQVEAIAKPK